MADLTYEVGAWTCRLGGLLLVVGVVLVLIVGPWDALRWALKANWRTTHGLGPLVGVVCLYVGRLLEKLGHDWKTHANQTRRA